jgi:hypothetical protein
MLFRLAPVFKNVFLVATSLLKCITQGRQESEVPLVMNGLGQLDRLPAIP